MRAIDADLIELLVREFAHGAGSHFDPRTAIGTQRESFRGLGFGWLYLGLAEVLAAKDVLVVGSGRGYTVACFALALEGQPGARVCFVDPGHAQWEVEDGVIDSAPGLWRDPAASARYFRERAGLHDVECLACSSDEAFERFRAAGRRFDLILIDGSHAYEQVARDLRNGLEQLAEAGLLLAHDTLAAEWSGPALAVEELLAARPELRACTIPRFPGLTLLQRGPWPLEIRLATAAENATINGWRTASGVVERPLADGDDPGPGRPGGDPREGLYAILDGGELIGGFGLRHRRFGGGGPDDFLPDAGGECAGFLLYGAVFRPQSRGRGRWRLVRFWIATRLCPEGFFSITRYALRGPAPFVTRRVGGVGPFTAFCSRVRAGEAVPEPVRGALAALRSAADTARAEADAARREIVALRTSTSWRALAPLRALLDLLRGRRRA